MKICRYVMLDASSAGSASSRYALIEGENVVEISGPPWRAWSRGSRSARLAEVRLLAPVEPSKIVCIGRNYAAHAAEMGNEVPKEPLMFLKPPSSIIGPEEAIVLPKYSQRVEHEGELALVIGRRCSQLSDAEDALSFVMGYTCLNDEGESIFGIAKLRAATADDQCEFAFVLHALRIFWQYDRFFRSDDGRGRLEEHQRLFRDFVAHLRGVGGIIAADANNLRRLDGSEQPDLGKSRGT